MIFTDKWWALVLGGIVTIAFGLCAFLLPGITLGAFARLIGVYAVAFGALMIGLGLELRSLGRRRDLETERLAA